MSKRALLYTRVSTDDQAEKGYSLPTQLAAAHQDAARLGLTVSDRLTFTDDCSGATLDRPALTRLRENLREGDTVMVYDPDRLSRDDVDFLVICREFDRAGAELVFINGGQVPDSAEGDIVRYLMGWKGKRERATIMERSLRGRRAKAASGKWVGAGHPPFGYRRVGERRNARLEICEAEAAIVRDIFQRFVDGEGIRTLAENLTTAQVPPPSRSREGTQWYQTTIKRILRNNIYVGILDHYGQTTRHDGLIILRLDAWQAAQDRLANNRRVQPAWRGREYLLTGFIHCTCGHRMHGCHVSPNLPKSYLYYMCSAVSHHEGGCRESVIPLPKVDAIVWGWLVDILTDDQRREKGLREYAARRACEVKPMQTEAEAVGELISKAERRVNRYAAALGDEEDEIAAAALRHQMNVAAQELGRLRERQATVGELIEQHAITQGKIDEIRRMAAALRRRLPGDPTYAQKRDLLDVLGVSVKLRRDEQRRRWLDLSCGIPDWGLQADIHSLA